MFVVMVQVLRAAEKTSMKDCFEQVRAS